MQKSHDWNSIFKNVVRDEHNNLVYKKKLDDDLEESNKR